MIDHLFVQYAKQDIASLAQRISATRTAHGVAREQVVRASVAVASWSVQSCANASSRVSQKSVAPEIAKLKQEMEEREAKINDIRTKMGRLETDVFADFSRYVVVWTVDAMMCVLPLCICCTAL